MTRTRPGYLTRLYLRRNVAAVTAFTPIGPDDAQTSAVTRKGRRRPASGAEAARRKDFGRVYGAANAEAGRKVRQEREQ